MIRKRITFYGYVQGVGFRWKSQTLANSLRLTGWVYNEYDGSVVMEVQGEDGLIDRMMQELRQDRYIEITDMDIKIIPVNEGERSFRVKH